MTRPRNTTKADPHEHLLGVMAGGTSEYIESQEAAGQGELVRSESLPTGGSEDPRLAEMGFTFDAPYEDDPIFRPASLPDGWKKVPSSHSMWSYVVDARGLRRLAVFYKAAFYDRSAHVSVVDVGRELVSAFLYEDSTIPYDVLTEGERASVREALELQAGEDPQFYKDKPEKAKRELERLG